MQSIVNKYNGLELVSHFQKNTENTRVLSKQVSSQRNRWPPWKMFMPLDKEQKHILTINISYFEISLQYSISCRSRNSAVFHPSSSVVWTSSENITLNALWSSVRGEVPHHARRDVVRDCPEEWDGDARILLCHWAISRSNQEFMIWLKRL